MIESREMYEQICDDLDHKNMYHEARKLAWYCATILYKRHRLEKFLRKSSYIIGAVIAFLITIQLFIASSGFSVSSGEIVAMFLFCAALTLFCSWFIFHILQFIYRRDLKFFREEEIYLRESDVIEDAYDTIEYMVHKLKQKSRSS